MRLGSTRGRGPGGGSIGMHPTRPAQVFFSSAHGPSHGLPNSAYTASNVPKVCNEISLGSLFGGTATLRDRTRPRSHADAATAITIAAVGCVPAGSALLRLGRRQGIAAALRIELPEDRQAGDGALDACFGCRSAGPRSDAECRCRRCEGELVLLASVACQAPCACKASPEVVITRLGSTHQGGGPHDHAR